MAPPSHQFSTVHRRKRVRIADTEPAESSTADKPSPMPTDFPPKESSNHDNDSESELSQSSEEPSDISSSEDDSDHDDTEADMAHVGTGDVINVRANRGEKPTMKLDKDEFGPDIRTFLKDFLPKLKAANEELEVQKQTGTLKTLDATDAKDGEPYIEMNLGLGVLEEKDSNAGDSSDSEGDTEDTGKEKDVLGKLMGQKRNGEPVNIEVLQDEEKT
ncbi:hypothetical protein IQ07DRAFT_590274 [Pyrenochaeta sp. DS3sAY3a]|nr:hypothetical protein IQ07DRAFT_590274 [Pyrenochaeta sp. DS3sAY3a]